MSMTVVEVNVIAAYELQLALDGEHLAHGVEFPVAGMGEDEATAKQHLKENIEVYLRTNMDILKSKKINTNLTITLIKSNEQI